MTTEKTSDSIYRDLHDSDEFHELRRRYFGFAVPATVIFVAWYLLYVICSNWATGFMSSKLIGNVNVALIFGILQFVSTFLIAWLYSRHANKSLDPLAAKLNETYEREVGR